MITIDKDKCIGCGNCIRDCHLREIQIIEKKAVPKHDTCMECGHCVAVCPTNAITLEDYDMKEVMELKGMENRLDPQVYLNHLKSRRSIRKFTGEKVSDDQLHMILEAGRYSPTGGNMQNVNYFISQKDIQNLKKRVISELKIMGEEDLAAGQKLSWYSERWIMMYDEYTSRGKDELFFDVDTVVVLSSNSPQSAMIAAAHMETMIYSLNLGMLYSGFTARAIAHSKELQEYIQLQEGYQVYAVLVIGHPAVKYVRTVPRKPIHAVWR